jgi:hypothetical protein
MQEKKQLRIFCTQDYGGLPFIRMLRNFVKTCDVCQENWEAFQER